MSRFFAFLSHHEPGNRDKFYFKKQLADKYLSIGWGEVNPVGSIPKKIKSDIKKIYKIGGTNASNGEKSLPLFVSLKPGDIIFIRGDAKILDVGIITDIPFYNYGNGHESGGFDYCTKVAF